MTSPVGRHSTRVCKDSSRAGGVVVPRVTRSFITFSLLSSYGNPASLWLVSRVTILRPHLLIYLSVCGLSFFNNSLKRFIIAAPVLPVRPYQLVERRTVRCNLRQRLQVPASDLRVRHVGGSMHPEMATVGNTPR